MKRGEKGVENLGWFSMHRKYEFEPVFDDAELWRTWCWIYMKASHKQHSLMVGKQLVTLMPGELIWGKRAVAKKLNIHESKAYRHLKLLEKMGLVETKPNHNFTVVKVIVWDIEQNYAGSNRTTNEPQTNHSGTTNEPQMNTNNNVNHVNTVKREKKDSQSVLSPSGLVPYPQSIAEVRKYCIQMGFTKVDPVYFFNYYEERNWMTGGKPIENWHALVKHWNDTQKEPFDPVQEQPTRVDQETKADSLSHELWSVYSDLSEDGEIEYDPIPPTSLEEVLEYCAGYSGHSQYAEEFYLYFKDKGWKVSEWIIRDWKLAFQIWAQLKEQNLNDQEIVIRMRQNRFSSLDSMFFCTEEERNKIKEKIDWRVKAAR